MSSCCLCICSRQKITFNGTSTDKWIIQIGGAAAIARNVYCGGATPSYILWAVTGAPSIGAGASFCCYIISPAAVSLAAGARLRGSMYSHTGACSLGDGSRITKL